MARRLTWLSGIGIITLAAALAIAFAAEKPIVAQAIAVVGVLVGVGQLAAALRGPQHEPAEYLRYVVRRGRKPRQVSAPLTVLGLRPGSTLQAAEQLMGGHPTETYPATHPQDETRRTAFAWTTPEVRLTVELDDSTAAAVRIAASVPDDAEVGLALDKDVVLGATTVGELLALLGEPVASGVESAENWEFYELCYRGGGEGWIRLRFQASTVIGDDRDPETLPVGFCAVDAWGHGTLSRRLWVGWPGTQRYDFGWGLRGTPSDDPYLLG